MDLLAASMETFRQLETDITGADNRYLLSRRQRFIGANCVLQVGYGEDILQIRTRNVGQLRFDPGRNQQPVVGEFNGFAGVGATAGNALTTDFDDINTCVVMYLNPALFLK